jgi:Methionine biosynthesis protein MetW
MLHVGKHAIVSFDNAGYWRERVRAALGNGMGHTLCSGEPRVRAITLDQFRRFSEGLNARIEKAVFVSGRHPLCCLPALCANMAVYVLTRV